MRPELEAWAEAVIGVVEIFTIGVIDPLWTQRYAVAIDDLNPLYFDDEFARRKGHRGILAPPNYLATLRGQLMPGPDEQELLADGMAAAARPPLAQLKAMGGGQRLRFHNPAYCGEAVIARRQVTDLQEKAGRNGSLIIITDVLDYAAETGEPKLTLTNTLLCSWIDE